MTEEEFRHFFGSVDRGEWKEDFRVCWDISTLGNGIPEYTRDLLQASFIFLPVLVVRLQDYDAIPQDIV